MNIIETYLNFRSLSYGNNPNKIILHHAEVRHCSIQDIHQWHLENGWAGCGYHFLVRKDGTVYRGRPIEAIGSHCKGQNSTSIGICAEGDYMTEIMPYEQKKSIIELIAYLRSQYGNLPVLGHAEAMNFETSCPGTNYPLDDIKNEIFGTNFNSVIKEEKELKNIVGFNNQVDKRAAEYLADFLNCPTIDITATANAIDFSKIENVYFVGGGTFPQIANSKIIKGNDRYDTVIEVLKNIGKLK